MTGQLDDELGQKKQKKTKQDTVSRFAIHIVINLSVSAEFGLYISQFYETLLQ